MRLAFAGAKAIKDKVAAHAASIEQRGYGTHYGARSNYQPPAGRTLTPSDTTSWAMECAKDAFGAAGQGPTWDVIARETVANQMRGTVLTNLLVRTGWTGLYYNPDVARPQDGRWEHPHSFQVAQRERRYHDVPVDDFVVNYRPSEGSTTALDRGGVEKLADVPFWIGCANGGEEIFCGTRDRVSRFVADAEATQAEAIQAVPLPDYERLSGVICVPRGLWR